LPISALIDLYSQRVTIDFRNSSNATVDLYLRSVDGSEMLVTPRLPAGRKIELPSQPYHLWIIRNSEDDEIRAAFLASTDKQQVCDLKRVIADAEEGEAAIQKLKPSERDKAQGRDKPNKRNGRNGF
jgi:hypothetical protein